jgi:MOSC domain-containing protein YiiM
VKILSIQIGKPKTFDYGGKPITTGIFKDPIPGPIMLRKLNIEGDGQADLRVHGGVDKALYAYPNDVYEIWKKTRPGDAFGFGAMGENLSVSSLPEDQIYIGDTYELGDAIVQAVQPRFPCFKLSLKFEDPTILKDFMAINRPGVYFRVLQEGMIDVGDEFKLKDREKFQFSIQELFNLMDQDEIDVSRVKQVLGLKSLNPEWRVRLQRKCP